MSLISGRTFGVLTIASVVYYVVAALAMHLLQPELDPLMTPMSVYVLGAYGPVMTTTFFVLCAGLLGVGFGLIQTLPRTRLIKIAFALTIVGATGVFIAGLFPNDWPPPPRSVSGILHVLGGQLLIPAMTVAPGLFSLNFRSDGYWRKVSVVALALSAGVIAALMFGLTQIGGGSIGLAQRLFFASLFAWMILVGLHLTRARCSRLLSAPSPTHHAITSRHDTVTRAHPSDTGTQSPPASGPFL
jgi:hypothetical protein